MIAQYLAGLEPEHADEHAITHLPSSEEEDAWVDLHNVSNAYVQIAEVWFMLV